MAQHFAEHQACNENLLRVEGKEAREQSIRQGDLKKL